MVYTRHFGAGTKDFSSFIRPRVQKRIKVTNVSLRSQRRNTNANSRQMNSDQNGLH